MKQRNYKYYLLIITMMLCMTGCKKTIEKPLEEKNETGMYYNLKRQDKYLYEIAYKDYRYDTNLETISSVEEFGCSSVKNGDYFGRNFDFIFNDIPEFVVKVDKKDNRHASIGLSHSSSIHANDTITDNYIEKLELLPNFMLDGINDAGVIASCNVVPKEDVLPVTGTNPEKEDLHMGYMIRYILDNASSAENAIELLSNRNIYGDIGEHYNLHLMVSDKNKTYIVEFIDNKMVAIEKNGNEQIMTNFYTNLDYLTENSAGVERYNILKENYDLGSSFDGMWQLMQKVKYSQAYLFNLEEEWDSEYIPQSVIKNPDKSILHEYQRQYEEYQKDYWVSRTYDKRVPVNSSYWLTVHNSIYDIENKKLRLTIQEDYTKYYEYELN